MKCGTGNYDNDRAICFPTSAGECPITNIAVANSAPTSGGTWIANGTFSDGYTLYLQRERQNNLASVDLELHLTEYSSVDYEDGVSYDSNDNDRGPCYTGVTQKFTSEKIAYSTSQYFEYLTSYPSSCRRDDSRFVLFDKHDSEDHFLGNLAQRSECAGFTLYSTSDANYNSASDPDYRNSGVSCDSTGNCIRSSTVAGSGCASSDSVCETAFNQNLCGQYVDAVRSLSGSANSFGLYQRGEIIWESDCAVTRDQVKRTEDELRATLAGQLAVVIIAYIFGIVFSLCIPLCGVCQNSHQREGTTDSGIGCPWRVHPDFEKVLIRSDPCLHLVRIIPLIVTIISLGRI